MSARLAFTAKFWGDLALVCRAVEDRPGPVVHQEFGPFDTWTQAAAFAAKLNEGLEIPPSDALHITSSSLLACADLLRAGASSDSIRKRPSSGAAADAVQLRFPLSGLRLATAFCRRACVVPSGQSHARIIRDARNTLFDVMDFVLRTDFGDRELDEISAASELLKTALQDVSRQCEVSSAPHDSFTKEVIDHESFLDASGHPPARSPVAR